MRRLDELFSLKGRVAVVTGGAGHLARAIGEALAESGASVAIVDLDREPLEARAVELRTHAGGNVLPIVADLSDGASAAHIVSETVRRLGRLDVLVHNAAYTGESRIPGYAAPFELQTAAAWESALRVNVGAAFTLAQAAREALDRSGHGAIVNVASIYALVGPDLRLYEGTSMANPAAYGASKGGLLQLTRYLATVLAPGIRVNAISPGGIERGQPDVFRKRYVERTPLGRMAHEEDLKAAIAYLASDASAYVTGQNLVVDGGWTAW